MSAGAPVTFLAAVVAAAGLFAGLASTDLWPPDETRVAEISREMTVEGSWSLPRLNGEPFLEEPPLFYWLQAGSFRLFGDVSAWTARLPAAIGALAGISVTAGLAAAVGADPAIAVLVLATAPEYWWMARTATPDTTMAAATGLALLLFYLAWRSGRRRWLVGAALAVGVAFWLKSLLGAGLAVAVAATFVGWAGRGRLRLCDVAVALLVVAALAGGWLLLLVRTTGLDGAYFFLVTNHLERLRGARLLGHVRPILYYTWNLLLDFFPWSLALPVALATAWKRRSEPRAAFLLVWAVVVIGALTASASKRAHYALAAYPAVAILIAMWWQASDETRLSRATLRAIGAVVLLCPLIALVLGGGSFEDLIAVRTDWWAKSLRFIASFRPLSMGALVGAIAALLFGVAYRAAERRHDRAATAVAAAAVVSVVHLVVVLVVLPRLDEVCSARAVAERLASAHARGERTATFGFENREAVSPFMFYAGHRLPALPGPAAVRRLLDGPACVLAAATALHRLDDLPGDARWRSRIGGKEVMLIAGRSATCGNGPGIPQ